MKENKKFNSTKFLIYIGIVIVLSFIFSLKPHPVIYNLDGTVATTSEIRQGLWLTLLITIPFIGIILSGFMAFIPFKERTYNEKFFRLAILTVLGLESFVMLASAMSFFS